MLKRQKKIFYTAVSFFLYAQTWAIPFNKSYFTEGMYIYTQTFSRLLPPTDLIKHKERFPSPEGKSAQDLKCQDKAAARAGRRNHNWNEEVFTYWLALEEELVYSARAFECC